MLIELNSNNLSFRKDQSETSNLPRSTFSDVVFVTRQSSIKTVFEVNFIKILNHLLSHLMNTALILYGKTDQNKNLNVQIESILRWVLE